MSNHPVTVLYNPNPRPILLNTTTTTTTKSLIAHPTRIVLLLLLLLLPIVYVDSVLVASSSPLQFIYSTISTIDHRSIDCDRVFITNKYNSDRTSCTFSRRRRLFSRIVISNHRRRENKSNHKIVNSHRVVVRQCLHGPRERKRDRPGSTLYSRLLLLLLLLLVPIRYSIKAGQYQWT